MTTAIYAGSFDSITNGHFDIIERACGMFDKLHISIGINPDKRGLFTVDERIEIIEKFIHTAPATSPVRKTDIVVDHFEGLLVEHAVNVEATHIVRGLRADDFSPEFGMYLVNRKLAPNIETVYLMAPGEFLHISSSNAKQIVRFGGDASSIVPPFVVKRMKEKMGLS